MSHFIVWLYCLSVLFFGFSLYFGFEIARDYVRSKELAFGDGFGLIVIFVMAIVAASLAGAAHALSVLS